MSAVWLLFEPCPGLFGGARDERFTVLLLPALYILVEEEGSETILVEIFCHLARPLIPGRAGYLGRGFRIVGFPVDNPFASDLHVAPLFAVT